MEKLIQPTSAEREGLETIRNLIDNLNLDEGAASPYELFTAMAQTALLAEAVLGESMDHEFDDSEDPINKIAKNLRVAFDEKICQMTDELEFAAKNQIKEAIKTFKGWISIMNKAEESPESLKTAYNDLVRLGWESHLDCEDWIRSVDHQNSVTSEAEYSIKKLKEEFSKITGLRHISLLEQEQVGASTVNEEEK